MEVDDEIRELVLVGASALELKKKAIERGMITLRRSGLIKVGKAGPRLKKWLAKRSTRNCKGKEDNYGTFIK